MIVIVWQVSQCYSVTDLLAARRPLHFEVEVASQLLSMLISE